MPDNRVQSEAILEDLVDDYLERLRRGEQPEVAEYVERHPDLASQIEAVFPALGLVEAFKPGSGDATGSLAGALVPGIGTKLERLGDFRLLREVGRGGMGCVYEAEQESLGRRVAIKVLAGHRLLDPKLLARFDREAKAAARLHHTNIVPVFGVGEHEGVHFYVMQFIQGLGLDAVLDEVRRIQRSRAEGRGADPATSNGSPTAASVAHSLVSGWFPPPEALTAEPAPAASPAGNDGASDSSDTLPARSDLTSAGDSSQRYALEVARIGLQVAEALEYAHQQGILHRDIKPANLLLDAHGNVWVADFGLAKVGTDSDLTQTGDIVGTVRYMAPERFQGKCDAHSDVYALGLTLYELLARRPAFEFEDRNALIREVTQGAPKRLRALERSVPRDLETIVHKAIEREPAHRYPSAALLAEDLRRFLEDRPIAARRIGAGERLARWARRNPWVAGLTAAVFGLMVLLTAGSTLSALRIRRSEQHALREAHRAEAEARRATAARQDVEAGNASLRAREIDLRQAVYAARLNLVQAAFDAGDVTLGAARLDQTVPRKGESDLRGFEWNYWRRKTHDERTFRRLPPEKSFYGSWGWELSRDGTRAAGTVEISAKWVALVVLDTATLQPLFTEPIPRYRLYSRSHFALNQDGTRVASYHEEKSDGHLALRVWDVATRQRLLEHNDDGVNWVGEPHLVISPDGKRVARFGVDGDLGIWDVNSGRRLLQVERKGPQRPGSTRIAFRPDGMRLAMARADSGGSLRPASTVLEWDLSSQKERTLRPRSQDTVYFGLTYSPDGSRLMSGGSTLGGGRRWIDVLDAATGFVLRRIEPAEGVMKSSYLNCSTDGRRLVIFDAFNGSLELHDTTSGDLLQVFHGSVGESSSVQFRKDGAGLVSIGTDHVLKTWDIVLAPVDASAPSDGAVGDAAITDDGTRLAAVSSTSPADPWTVVVRETTDGREVGRIVIPELQASSLRLGTVLGAGGMAVAFQQYDTGDMTEGRRRLIVADVATGKVRFELSGTDVFSYLIQPRLSFRPDGLAVALCTSGPSKEVQIRDATDGRVLARWGAGPYISTFAYNRDGSMLAVAGSETRNGTLRSFVRLHDPANGRVLRTLEGNTANFAYLAFSTDGTRLATGNRNRSSIASEPDSAEVFVWDLSRAGSAPVRVAGVPHASSFAAFSPDGSRIAVAGTSGPSR